MGRVLVTRDKVTGIRTYTRKCRWCSFEEVKHSSMSPLLKKAGQ